MNAQKARKIRIEQISFIHLLMKNMSWKDRFRFAFNDEYFVPFQRAYNETLGNSRNIKRKKLPRGMATYSEDTKKLEIHDYRERKITKKFSNTQKALRYCQKNQYKMMIARKQEAVEGGKTNEKD